MAITLALPEWVRPVPLGDVDTATALLADELAAAQERGRVGRGELESAASQVVEEAFEQDLWLLALVRPPGRAAALLSVLGLSAPAPLYDRAADHAADHAADYAADHAATELAAVLVDRGGPGLSGVCTEPLDGLGSAVLAHRVDAGGAQAQAVLASPGESGRAAGAWFLLTLASPDDTRGPELQALLLDLVRTATAS